MKSLWDEKEAAQCKDDLDMRVYTSRLLGRDASLVLHGGGNTSVKCQDVNLFGETEDVLYVKGSGWDLESIDRPGFAPVKLNHLVRLASLPRLSDPQMVNELKTHTTISSAPTPSVEAILHAILPYKFVDHTHADAIVTLTNNPNGEEIIQQLFADCCVIVPYIMPGFDLARLCAQAYAEQSNENTRGMILLNHGIFSFDNDARTSYETMIELVSRAEEYLQSRNAWELALPEIIGTTDADKHREEIASLRADISVAAGKSMIVALDDDPRTQAFCHHSALDTISQQGPATPDHVIRTKQLPLCGRDVKGYVSAYKLYFEQHAPNAKDNKTMLEPAPRVVLDPALGMLAVGASARDAFIVRDIYQHTVEIILRAEKLGGYRALSSQDIFDMEYWDLEQAKLQKGGEAPMFQGEVVLITGAASGIGKACVNSWLARGAAVVGLDVSPDVSGVSGSTAYRGIICDVSDETQLVNAIEIGVRCFGGIDMAILNAGLFPGGTPVAELEMDAWRRVMSVNLDANVVLLRELYPLLKHAFKGGRVIFMGSKNVPAPGPGAAAYSASKAALGQLARITALEWSQDNIRVNILHPDAVFDTGIWNDEVLEARAAHYGMSVQEYKTKNLLGVEITSADVAELAADVCGPHFSATTAAQIPVDGGNDRVI